MALYPKRWNSSNLIKFEPSAEAMAQNNDGVAIKTWVKMYEQCFSSDFFYNYVIDDRLIEIDHRGTHSVCIKWHI
jgi:hypothetical protein